jgi:hypothetical protein
LADELAGVPDRTRPVGDLVERQPGRRGLAGEDSLERRVSDVSTPIPDGRGRWRLTLHKRQFDGSTWQQTMIGQLDSARTRKLVQAWDMPATFTFDMDGHASDCALISELQHDVIAWRWDETAGADIPVYRGMVDASEDRIDEQSHAVTFTCHDYLAMLNRRMITFSMQTVYSADQDAMAFNFLDYASRVCESTDGGTVFTAGRFLPLFMEYVNPNGSNRGSTPSSGISRSHADQGNQVCLTELDALAKLTNGFDYDVKPLCMNGDRGTEGAAGSAPFDALRIFFPRQGVTNNAAAFAYGSSVSKVQRQVTAADYTNYWRTIGNNQSAIVAPQVYGENWNSDANSTTVGTFMSGDQAASTTDNPWLGAVAAGKIGLYGTLVPTYVVTLTPGWYSWGLFYMGDTVPLIINSGRLGVMNTQRVLGITYNIGDDGAEDVDVVLGRATTTLGGMMRAQDHNINALARR